MLVLFISANESAPWLASEELWSQTAARLVGETRCAVAAWVQGWKPEAPQIARLEQAGCQMHRGWDAGERSSHELPASERPSCVLDRLRPALVVLSQVDNLGGLAWMEACIERGLRYVTVAHGAAEHRWPPDEVASRLAAGFERAEVCYFVSNANLILTRRQVAAPLANARISPVPYRVSFDASWSWPAEDGLVKLACVARLDLGQKGHDVLFDVLRLPRWRERPVQVTLFGDGDHRRGVTALIESLGLDNVILGGFAEDVEAVWRDHHALVLPSRWEGLPAAIIEAMLCGRPAIVADVAGNTELVTDSVTGFVARAPTAGLLDDAMERAWQALERWPKIGRAAAAAVRATVPRDPIGVFAGELKQLLAHADA